MFDQFYKRPKAVNRQLNAPFLEDRLRYLSYRAEQGAAHNVLLDITVYLPIVIKYLHLQNNDQIITLKDVEIAAKRWAHHQMKSLKCVSGFTSKRNFIKHAKQWLQFLGRIEIPQPVLPAQVTKFVEYMRKEQDLSEATIQSRRYELINFFKRIKKEPEQFLTHLTPAHLDAIQIQEIKQGIYTRRTMQRGCGTLRSFFHYAERQGWCKQGIANSIQSPRIYKHETLPSGPSLEDVQRLLKTTKGNSPPDIRDRAIILFLAVYGLRSSEVRRLRIEDFDWDQKIFRLKHSKHGPTQRFPLVQTVGNALVRYLKEIRPQCSIHREIFLTLRAPFRPIKSLSGLIFSRWKPLNVAIKHHGAHSLRHACATRLINQGMSLKTIADQLGHRDLESTRIYAKVDLTRLREVANFNLRGIL